MSNPDGIRRFCRIGRAERDVREEIAFHLESRVRDLVATGMTRDAAWALARQEFGDVDAAERELAERARQRELNAARGKASRTSFKTCAMQRAACAVHQYSLPASFSRSLSELPAAGSSG